MKYRRLQVGPVWLRTLLEIALMLLALVACTTKVVSYYESSYYESTQSQAAEANAQLAHSLKNVVDLSLLSQEGERLEYIKESYYRPLLDRCFVQGDVLGSCAIYVPVKAVEGEASEGVERFVASSAFPEELTAGQLSDLDSAVHSGQTVSASYERANMTYIPYYDSVGNLGAVLVVSSEYRESMDYNSIVSDRVTRIALLGGGIIVIYYVISGIVSARGKRKEALVG